MISKAELVGFPISALTPVRTFDRSVQISALGQKQTFAVQNVMSALLPIATAKADMCPAKGHVRLTPKADIAVPV